MRISTFGLRLLLGVAGSSLPLAFAGSLSVQVGDGQIDGRSIEPYGYVWRQCSFSEGVWGDGGTVTERATESRDDVREHLVVEQETHMPNGVRVVSITHFDRVTLAPLRVATDAAGPDGQPLANSRYVLGPDGYHGEKHHGDASQSVSGPVSSREYHGMNLGLALATLDLSDGMSVELPVSMLSMDATYKAIATVNGSESLVVAGRRVQAWLVDVEWRHLGIGDVYPPGPDASGGRYWIVTDPPTGVPHVLRYKTDTYAIEIEPRVCPRSDTSDS